MLPASAGVASAEKWSGGEPRRKTPHWHVVASPLDPTEAPKTVPRVKSVQGTKKPKNWTTARPITICI
jgi:hypothetical protein